MSSAKKKGPVTVEGVGISLDKKFDADTSDSEYDSGGDSVRDSGSIRGGTTESSLELEEGDLVGFAPNTVANNERELLGILEGSHESDSSVDYTRRRSSAETAPGAHSTPEGAAEELQRMRLASSITDAQGPPPPPPPPEGGKGPEPSLKRAFQELGTAVEEQIETCESKIITYDVIEVPPPFLASRLIWPSKKGFDFCYPKRETSCSVT